MREEGAPPWGAISPLTCGAFLDSTVDKSTIPGVMSSERSSTYSRVHDPTSRFPANCSLGPLSTLPTHHLNHPCLPNPTVFPMPLPKTTAATFCQINLSTAHVTHLIGLWFRIAKNNFLSSIQTLHHPAFPLGSQLLFVLYTLFQETCEDKRKTKKGILTPSS